VFHLHVIKSEQRDHLLDFLKQNGVGSAIHYPVPVHLQPAYRELSFTPLPVTEQTALKICSLPMYPELTDEQISTVIETANRAVKAR